MYTFPLGLYWDSEEEKQDAANRVLSLTDNQILELSEKVGITWIASEEELAELVKGMRKEKLGSPNLDTLLTEADSKEDLLKWISYFEKKNSLQ